MQVDAGWVNPALADRWTDLRLLRLRISAEVEPLRRDKLVGSSLEVDVRAIGYNLEKAQWISTVDMAELAIIANFEIDLPSDWEVASEEARERVQTVATALEVTKTTNNKCGRCWRHLPEVVEDGALCARCEDVVGG